MRIKQCWRVKSDRVYKAFTLICSPDVQFACPIVCFSVGCIKSSHCFLSFQHRGCEVGTSNSVSDVLAF